MFSYLSKKKKKKESRACSSSIKRIESNHPMYPFIKQITMDIQF
jgi:hypothetical protein